MGFGFKSQQAHLQLNISGSTLRPTEFLVGRCGVKGTEVGVFGLCINLGIYGVTVTSVEN